MNSTKELAKENYQTVKSENFFSEEILVPKILALIKISNYKNNANNYQSIESHTKQQKLMRAIEWHNFEKHFWRKELEKIVGAENMQSYYSKREAQKDAHFFTDNEFDFYENKKEGNKS